MDAAPPWDYNPSAWSQRIPICALAAVGFLISTYMALYQWRLVDSVWDPMFGSQTQRVLDSDVSHRMMRLFGMPDAALGAVAYLGDIVFGLAGSTRRWQHRPWLVVLCRPSDRCDHRACRDRDQGEGARSRVRCAYKQAVHHARTVRCG